MKLFFIILAGLMLQTWTTVASSMTTQYAVECETAGFEYAPIRVTADNQVRLRLGKRGGQIWHFGDLVTQLQSAGLISDEIVGLKEATLYFPRSQCRNREDHREVQHCDAQRVTLSVEGQTEDGTTVYASVYGRARFEIQRVLAASWKPEFYYEMSLTLDGGEQQIAIERIMPWCIASNAK